MKGNLNLVKHLHAVIITLFVIMIEILSFSIITLVPLVPSSIQAQTFSYDGAGHVTEAAYPNGTSVRYKYDAAGNLKKVKTVTGVMVSINGEGVSGDFIRFSLHRTGDLSQALTVDLSAEGDAVNGEDYLLLPARVAISAHESSVVFSVNLRADRAASAAKKFTVSLNASDEYNLDARSSATIIIPAKKQ